MANTSKRGMNRQGQRPGPTPGPRGRGTAGRRAENVPVEKDPAVERGERIDTGKTIARGGKTTGTVPGATAPK